MASILLSLLMGSGRRGEVVAENVYTASQDGTVRKINKDGNQLWSFSGHFGTVYAVAVDFDGFVYSAGNDGTVRKINPYGAQIWSFTGHTGAVYSVAVDTSGNVYTAGADNTVRKINSSGSQVWSFTGHSNEASGVAVDPSGNVYSGALDNTVRKISSAGSQLWSYNVGSGVSEVRVAGTRIYAGDFSGSITWLNTSGALQVQNDFFPASITKFAADDVGDIYASAIDLKNIRLPTTTFWTFTSFGGGGAEGVAVDEQRFVFVGDTNGKLQKINGNTTAQIWEFTGHTATIQGVANLNVMKVAGFTA